MFLTLFLAKSYVSRARCRAGRRAWTCASGDIRKRIDRSTLRDQVGAIAGTGEPAVPGPLSENETPRPDRLGTGSNFGKTRHQFAVVDAGRTIRICPKIIFANAGRLVSHEAVQRRFDRLQLLVI